MILSVPGIANAGLFTAENYDDCILENIKNANTDFAVITIKDICKRKHPKTFNFEHIANLNNKKTIREVSKEKKIDLSHPANTDKKNYYFRAVIKPNIHPDFIDEAEQQFDLYVKNFKK